VLTIDNSHIDNNSSWVDGGGVYVEFNSASGGHDNVSFTNSTLSHNVAGPTGVGRGGAFYVISNSALGAHDALTAVATHFDDYTAPAA
jgi:hypothetical protein